MKTSLAFLLGKHGPNASNKRGSFLMVWRQSLRETRPSLSTSILRTVISMRSFWQLHIEFSFQSPPKSLQDKYDLCAYLDAFILVLVQALPSQGSAQHVQHLLPVDA